MAKDRYYTVEKLGRTRSRTTEGFLVCEGVPIARIGQLVYGPEETPLKVGADGLVKVIRGESDLFSPDTIASFEGKPVTLGHPDEDVNPNNFKQYVVGVSQNVRRGEGADKDLLLSDIVIHDKEAIDAVCDDGISEVSCGYDADYEEVSEGNGRQLNIIGNHIALVKRGRCGSRCAIQDRSMEMAKKTWKDRVREAFKAKDEEKLEEAMGAAEEGSSEPTHVHVHVNGSKTEQDEVDPAEVKTEKAEGGSTEERLARLESLMEEIVKMLSGSAEDEASEEAPAEEGQEEQEEDKKTYQDTAARLEVLSPGLKAPAFSAKDKKFKDAVQDCKRKALEAALTTDGDLIGGLLNGSKVDDLKGKVLDAVFVGASEVMKAKNNTAGVRTSVKVKDFGKVTTIADINKRNADFWANRA